MLSSDNREAPSFPAGEETIPIARLVAVVRPQSMGPPVGAVIAEEGLEEAFGVSEAPRTGRIDGHLFLMVEAKGALTAPDRVSHPIERRPGETEGRNSKRGCRGRPAGTRGGWAEHDGRRGRWEGAEWG